MERIEIDLKTGERKAVQLTAEEIAAAEAKNAAEAAMKPQREIERLERENPITHRGQREKAMTDDAIFRILREKINALDAEIAALAGRAPAPLPEIPVSHGLAAVKMIDDAIKLEREKL